MESASYTYILLSYGPQLRTKEDHCRNSGWRFKTSRVMLAGFRWTYFSTAKERLCELFSLD